MRIGIFSDTYSPDINGVVSSIVTLQESLIEAGHDVFVVTTKHGLYHLSYENNVLRLPGIEIKRMYGYVLTTPVQLRAYRIVKEMNLDVIHVHTEFGVGVFGHVIGKMLKLPIVSTYHTTYEDYTHYVNTFNLKSVESIAKKAIIKLSRLFGSSSSVIIAPSNKTKEMLVRYGIKREIVVIPTGLNLERFDNEHKNQEKIDTMKNSLGLSNEDKIVLYVGRLAKEKSIDVVINGFEEIAKINNNIKCIIVGSGPAEEELKHVVKVKNLQDSVLFLGKIDNSEIADIYHMADVFVSASTTETQGLTFVEAMASGLMVFARYDEAISDLIINDETGFYFEDYCSLAHRILEYFTIDENKQREMLLCAKNKVQIYDKRTFSDRIVEAYIMAHKIYNSNYTIQKIHYSTKYAKLELTSPYDNIELTIFKETCEKKKMEEGKMITKDDLSQLLEDEKVASAYQICVRKISYKDRTQKEVYDYLMEKTGLNAQQMNLVVSILKAQNLIDDESIVKDQFDSMSEKLLGKHKIVLDLRNRGIPTELIDKYLYRHDFKVERESAIKYARQLLKNINEPSVYSAKEKIRRKLIYRGYDSIIADNAVAALNYSKLEKSERENCMKYALKMQEYYTRLNIKDPKSKRRKIASAVAKKGFELSLVSEIMREIEGEFNYDD